MGHAIANDKLKKICDSLREDALKPAEEQADILLKEAKIKADKFISEAREEANRIIKEADEEAANKLIVAKAEIERTLERSLDVLKQSIENKIFKENLVEWLDSSISSSEVSAEFIKAIIVALEKQGLDSDLTVYISRSLNSKEVNKLLGKEILKKLRESSVILGNFSGGVKVRVNQKSLELDVTTEALKDLFSRYLRKDFREILFHQ